MITTDLVQRREKNFQTNFPGLPRGQQPLIGDTFAVSLPIPLPRSDTDFEFSKRANPSAGYIGRARAALSIPSRLCRLHKIITVDHRAVLPLPNCPEVSRRPQAAVIYATQSNIAADPRVYSAGFATITATVT